MYTVTFYSFKGGVGRTMSLVNVGIQLAQSGKKVLLVDMDLEAPGLPTFEILNHHNNHLGIVDYIDSYVWNGEAPDVKDYIYKTKAKFDSAGEIWVMPVGLQDANYSRKLNSIDWKRLYEQQSGYLFFEDLKAQWKETVAPDYVLIDSRTGHSDVEGICTRQLPDSVAILFFPNDQNLIGLTRIVDGIRNENSRETLVNLHFAVSNVPDLDDEHQILCNTLNKFQSTLKYKELSAVIHHYNSLSLLKQEVFSLTRPNSKLAKEYSLLTNSIRSKNIKDREAVLEFLSNATRDLSKVIEDVGPQELSDKIERYKKTYEQDGEILFNLGILQNQLGNQIDALSLLSSSFVEQQFPNGKMYALRSQLNYKFGNKDAVYKDLESMLDSKSIDIESLLETSHILEIIAPNLQQRLPKSNAFKSLSFEDKVFFVLQQDGDEMQLKVILEILNDLRQENDEHKGTHSNFLKHELALTNIALGNFKEAQSYLVSDSGDISTNRLSDSFNYAMALWGEKKEPNIGYFEIVKEQSLEFPEEVKRKDLNFSQCMAITYAVIGEMDEAWSYLNNAISKVEELSWRIFSAWTYTKVSKEEMREHLLELSNQLENGKIEPRFIHN